MTRDVTRQHGNTLKVFEIRIFSCIDTECKFYQLFYLMRQLQNILNIRHKNCSFFFLFLSLNLRRLKNVIRLQKTTLSAPMKKLTSLLKFLKKGTSPCYPIPSNTFSNRQRLYSQANRHNDEISQHGNIYFSTEKFKT